MSWNQAHLALNVKGLIDKPKRQYQGLFAHDDGRPMTPDEAKRYLLDELAKGHDLVPYGRCDNFDPKKGCLGHPRKGGA